MVELGEKGSEPQIRRLPILCHPDVKRVRGDTGRTQAAFRYDGKDVGWKRTRGRVCERGPDGRKRNVRFPGTPGGVICAILEIRVDNERTRKRLEEEPEETGAVTPFQAFASFYEAVRHCPMTEEQETILARMVEEAEEEERV